jgi:hypothetical protein
VVDPTDLFGLGGLAAFLQIAGYLIYIRYFVKHSIKPNAASWVMFAYGTSLLAFLELKSGATLQVLMLPLSCAAMSVVVAALCIPRGVREPIDRVEGIAFATDLWLTIAYAAAMFGWGAGRALSAGFLVLANVTAFTCFLPIVRSTWRAPDRERAGPWMVWASAYAVLGFATWRADGGHNPALMLYPVINAVLHGSVALFALRRGSEHRVYIDKARTVYIGDSAIHGRGVHAGRGFGAGDVIWKMTGKPVFHSSAEGEPNLVGVSPTMWIDPDPPISHMNHSCAPNAAFGPKFELVALQPIFAHDEITFDYSTTEADPAWTMACACAHPDCRAALRAIQIAFAGAHEPPAASPIMQQLWRREKRLAEARPAFPQLAPQEWVGDATPAEDRDEARRVG